MEEKKEWKFVKEELIKETKSYKKWRGFISESEDVWTKKAEYIGKTITDIIKTNALITKIEIETLKPILIEWIEKKSSEKK